MIDDLFDSPKKDDKSQSDPRIGFDHIRTEVFPYNIEEYSEIIINNIYSPMLSEFSKDKLNILNSDPNQLLFIDPSLFTYDKKQYNNIMNGLSKKEDYTEDFMNHFISRETGLLPLDPSVLGSLSAINNGIFFYKTFEKGLAEKAFIATNNDILLKDNNLAILYKIRNNLSIIQLFTKQGNNAISKRLL